MVLLAAGVGVVWPMPSGAQTMEPAASRAVDGGAVATALPPRAGPVVRVGVIEGEVALNLRPPRRSAARYRGGAPPHPIQSVPAVVYLRGTVAGASGRPPESASMAQRDTAFAPPVVVIGVGGTVAFPNGDPFFHNVFSYSSAERFDLGRYPMGDSKSVTFREAGVVKVYCEVHEFMRSAVVVTENPYWAIVEDGRFRIEGVPAGTHTLVAWHSDLDVVEQEVTVTDGGTARVNVRLGG